MVRRYGTFFFFNSKRTTHLVIVYGWTILQKNIEIVYTNLRSTSIYLSNERNEAHHKNDHNNLVHFKGSNGILKIHFCPNAIL